MRRAVVIVGTLSLVGCGFALRRPSATRTSPDDARRIADEFVAAGRADTGTVEERLRLDRALLARLDRRRASDFSSDSSRVFAAIVRATIGADSAMQSCRHWTDASLAQGVACYRARVRSYSGVDAEPDTLLAIGRRELARIEGEMNRISARAFGGRAADSVLAALQAAPRFTTAAAVDSAAAAIIAAASTAAGQWFGQTPRHGVALRPAENPSEAAPAATYYASAATGAVGDSAVIYLNYSAVTRLPRGALEPLMFHEGIPGHHLQIGTARGRPEWHPILALAPRGAFAEGWALYAEQLADQMGLVRNDTVRLMLLNSERQRAARLVADPAIHLMGWARDTAMAFLVAHGMSREQAANEFARYTILPGQATTYTLGLMAVREHRRRSEQILGAAFDLRRFHDRLLGFGSVPLPVIGEEEASSGTRPSQTGRADTLGATVPHAVGER